MKKFLLGAHMPTTGGFYKSALFGQEVGCSAIQIFTKSNRQWQAKNITAEDADLFKSALHESKIQYTVAHASYLINLASPEQATQTKSIQALEIELERCHQLGIKDLVLHPGSRKDAPISQALKQVAQNINLALTNSPKNTRILIETMAGQGSSVGSSFEQLAEILTHINTSSRVGICLDTCHIFAAGYDFTTIDNYHLMWKAFNETIGFNKLGLIHLNDSKKELGCKVDRHEGIGHGKIGKQAFELIMNDLKLIGVPKILETPKEDLEMDKKNLKYLVNLLNKDHLKWLVETNLEMYL
jgi:deoxyribonuclease-4